MLSHALNSRTAQFAASFGLSLVVVSLISTRGWADAENYRKALSGTAWVLAKNSEGTSSGTGVFIDQTRRLILTNAHVVGDSRNAVVFFPEVEDERPLVERSHYLENVKRLGSRGRVIAVDRKRDLALVQLASVPTRATAIELADKSASPGELIHSIGNPGSEALWVYTSGKVRGVYAKQFRTGAGEHDFTVLATDAAINPGDSGGPVVNVDGKLVGISQAIAPKVRLVSYCVDIGEIKAFMDSPWKPAPMSAQDLLQQAELTFSEHDSGHLQVEVSQDDQKEMVFVTKDVEYYERADLRKIWALATTTKESPTLETTLRLLQQSARTKLGSWAVEQDNRGQYMVIFCAKLDATATPATMKSAVEYVAKITVAMRKELQTEKSDSSEQTLANWLSNE